MIYLVKCPEKTYSEDYLGETARRINERVLEHNGKDKRSHTCYDIPYSLVTLQYR